MSRSVVRLFLVFAVFACLPALALAEEGDVTAELTARRVVLSGAGAESLESAAAARPGDVIEYRAVYTNRGDGTVRNLEGTLPIPAWTEYLPGTAVPAAATASIDGKVYGPVPLKRKVKYADGRQEIVDIPPAEYRFLRWNLGDLAPAARAEGALRVRVVTGVAPAAAEKPIK